MFIHTYYVGVTRSLDLVFLSFSHLLFGCSLILTLIIFVRLMGSASLLIDSNASPHHHSISSEGRASPVCHRLVRVLGSL